MFFQFPLMYIVTVNINIYRLISSFTALLRIRTMVVLPDVVQPAGRLDRPEERQTGIPNARVICMAYYVAPLRCSCTAMADYR